ncbi:hypothetical protein [Allobranchiibius sp. GilTou73]|uniref:hypothetical protein n=1 Tax=Allobranchiibius sp. GilTou73 TaxID=2904523 RepID=UPI001F20A87F|nr:hypothetical protein [Allobranchiibius sp. GilTou73]UIJ34598.1 hypothetical protein LVQ62_16085 [Allobranchiibius sp. GilTou73]
MRWSELFADLEAQLDAADRAELDAQVADRTRRERAAVSWMDRAAAALGAPLTVHTPCGPVRGSLEDLGADWLLLDEQGHGRLGSAVLPFSAVLSVTGLPVRSTDGRGLGRRFGIGVALRAIARDRGAVAVHDIHRGVVVGTVDTVGSDHLDIAEHPADAVRRSGVLTGHRAVPFRAIAVIRRG